jgi:hypothetical protein
VSRELLTKRYEPQLEQGATGISVDLNAQALRELLGGELPAKEISARVGWAPRSAGAKLCALERQGMVLKKVVVLDDETESVVWALTDRGAAIVAPKDAAVTRQAIATTPQPDLVALDDDATPSEQGPGTPGAGDENEGPWPSLRTDAAGVDPNTALSASRSAWLWVLKAAHSGAGEGSPGERRVVETHLATLERQLGYEWKSGRYETPDGTTVTPGKLEYLKRQDWPIPPPPAKSQ